MGELSAWFNKIPGDALGALIPWAVYQVNVE